VPEPERETNWRAWMVGVLAVLVLIVALQNSQDVEFEVLFIQTTAPLIAVLLLAVAVGAVIGYVGPLVRRHRREERRAGEG
jgi:uncharacterized integral membrane protein